jgi:hypothetical protein
MLTYFSRSAANDQRSSAWRASFRSAHHYRNRLISVSATVPAILLATRIHRRKLPRASGLRRIHEHNAGQRDQVMRGD